MRIGTWNLDGRWSPRHRRLLEDADCDVWLLTEVPAAFSLPGGDLVRSEPMPSMKPKSWAAVWSNQPSVEAPSPHPAAALVQLENLLICSCVLPWRGARPYWPDNGSSIAAITIAALDRLRGSLTSMEHPVVLGGDWNHAMTGREQVGSIEGRRAIEALVAVIGLTVTTVNAPHRIEGSLGIDHIAVPKAWTSSPSTRVVAEADGARLSDHDAYLVETTGR